MDYLNLGEMGNRFEELEERYNENKVFMTGDERGELEAIKEFASEVGIDPDISHEWEDRSPAIHVNDFTEYAKELAIDCAGTHEESDMLAGNSRPEEFNHWPWRHAKVEVDWEAAAEELKQDYTEVEFGGKDYLVRYF